jgi:hypothetical protein
LEHVRSQNAPRDAAAAALKQVRHVKGSDGNSHPDVMDAHRVGPLEGRSDHLLKDDALNGVEKERRGGRGLAGQFDKKLGKLARRAFGARRVGRRR